MYKEYKDHKRPKNQAEQTRKKRGKRNTTEQLKTLIKQETNTTEGVKQTKQRFMQPFVQQTWRRFRSTNPPLPRRHLSLIHHYHNIPDTTFKNYFVSMSP
jgi:hypothetical protein